MRETNAQRVIYKFLSGNYYFSLKDKLNIDENADIYARGTRIGKLIEDEVQGIWTKFLVLSMQDFKSDKAWKRYKESLIKAANEMGIFVVFDPDFDIGFGSERFGNKVQYNILTPDDGFDKLLKIAKYSNMSYKSAACVIKASWYNEIHAYDQQVAYTFNQIVDGSKYKAEDILIRYLYLIGCTEDKSYNKWITLTEPTESILRAMITLGARTIIYGNFHSREWNTNSYYQYTNEIWRGNVRSSINSQIYYARIENKKVIKFYGEKYL